MWKIPIDLARSERIQVVEPMLVVGGTDLAAGIEPAELRAGRPIDRRLGGHIGRHRGAGEDGRQYSAQNK
jgi:hypothetical protein